MMNEAIRMQVPLNWGGVDSQTDFDWMKNVHETSSENSSFWFFKHNREREVLIFWTNFCLG